MKRLLTGACDLDNVFQLIDPTQFTEADFEAEVVKALTCLMPEYLCGVFAGAFILEGKRHVADLALIHRRLSHWFVIEVELAGHSLEHHILPQVRCFRYGEPEESCITSLVRAYGDLSRERAEQFLHYVPRYVAVIGNIIDPAWLMAFTAVDVQYLNVSIFRSHNGQYAHEVEGRLTARDESLGFAQYSAIDNCLRIPKNCGLPGGVIQIIDQFGNLADWTVQEEAGVLWVCKNRGRALIDHDSYVQIIRTADGQISIRPSTR